MTKRFHRRGLLPPRRPRTITTYLGGLDNQRDEIMPRFHRDAAADDPWLSPSKSEAVRALLVLINGADSWNFTIEVAGNFDLDVQGFCQDAELTPRQTEVVCLTVDGWSQRAIGVELHIAQPTVWQHLSTGRHKLAGRLPRVVAERLALPIRREYSRGVEARLAVG